MAIAGAMSIEEFFESDKEVETSDFYEYTPDTESPDELEFALAILILLAVLYNQYKNKSPDYVDKNFNKDVDKKLGQIEKKFDSYSNKLEKNWKTSTLEGFKITGKLINKVKLDYNIKSTMKMTKTSLNAIFNQLKNDVNTKVQVWKDANKATNDFSINANFRRAIKRTKEATQYYNKMVTQKITRSALKFVYGKDMLFYWSPAHINTCEWCISQESMPPRRLEDWEFDHIHGNCILEPGGEGYSEDYTTLMESEEYFLNP